MAESIPDPIPTFRRFFNWLSRSPREALKEHRHQKRREKRKREVAEGRLGEFEQKLAFMLWDDFESVSAPLMAGIDELRLTGLVNIKKFLEDLAELSSDSRISAAQAVEGAFYTSVNPTALAITAQKLIREGHKES